MPRIENPVFNADSKASKWALALVPLAIAACQAQAEETPTPDSTLESLQTQVSEMRGVITEQSGKLEEVGTAFSETLEAIEETKTALPTKTPIPTITETPFPTATPTPTVGSVLRIAVVEDNSGGNFRNPVVHALRGLESRLDRELVVEGFESCDPDFLSEEWSLVVMDYQINNSLSGPVCIELLGKLAAKLGYKTPEIVGYAIGRETSFGASIDAYCEKPDLDCLVEEAIDLLSP